YFETGEQSFTVTENGINYGDTFEHVNFPYAAKLTAVNAITLASLAWAPLAPEKVGIGGIVEANARLNWSDVAGASHYKVHWRPTTAPQWMSSRAIHNATEHTLEGVVIDNFFFGVSAVSKDGHESLVVFPNEIIR
ncbi:MAG: M28 family metallopeptidase, partial [Flavobacteriaceae bacterium]